MWSRSWASAFKAGIFCVILAGLCLLLSSLFSRAFSLDPIVYFGAMSGVLMPAVMVASGILGRWASQSHCLFQERSDIDPALASLASGLVTVFGSILLCYLMLAVPFSGVLPSDGLWGHPDSFDVYGYMEVAVLFAAYLALAVIGGVLYDVVVRGEKALRS